MRKQYTTGVVEGLRRSESMARKLLRECPRDRRDYASLKELIVRLEAQREILESLMGAKDKPS